MNCKVERTELLTPELKRIFFGWSDHVFGTDGGSWTYLEPTARLIAFAQGTPVSHVGLIRSRVRVSGSIFDVIGIGYVVTPPPHQGKGFAAAALAEAARGIRADATASFGMLFCREHLVPFYAKQGWERIDAPVTVEQPGGAMPYASKPLILKKESPWPAGKIEVLSFPW